jgi:hypothetical protein
VTKSLRAREAFRALFYMPSIIPFVAAVLIFGGIMNEQIGWVNKMLAVVGIDGPNWFLDETWVYPSLVFIGLWAVGNALIIFIASMNGVPSSLYDAARIDGASEWQSFLMLAHHSAVGAMRDTSPREDDRLGIVLNLIPAWPQNDTDEDRAAASAVDLVQNRLFADAVIHVRYPDEVLSVFDKYGVPRR